MPGASPPVTYIQTIFIISATPWLTAEAGKLPTLSPKSCKIIVSLRINLINMASLSEE